ncbi:MAG TPA: DUF2339 domain-containing protein [Hyphomicrobiaceae bacterium]|nr:DUF2339 domain-containing protein [Hyphomicrobiaceae bacterium]
MTELALIVAVVALGLVLGARRQIALLQAGLDEARSEIRALRTPPAPPEAAAPAPEEAAPGREPAPAQPPVGAEEPAPVPAAVEPPVPLVPARAAPIVPAAATLEERLGTRWAVWLGGLALALGGVLLVRYSIEQGLFGPEVRIALGALFALMLVGAGEWFRRSERASPVEGVSAAHIPGILTAAGTVSGFGTVYAAHALYQMLGPAAAFFLLGAIGVATMLAAALHGPALAGLGLAAAFAVPLLITSQEPSPWPVVLYLAAVASAAYALARLRRWLWLAAATVAGAVAWGLALLDPVGAGAAGMWTSALIVHIGVQLALAAMFMAIEPHLTTAEDSAEPDWIATLALAAIAALAVLALLVIPQDGTVNQQWLAFAFAAMALLGVTAWRSAPAAAAAPLAGMVALAAMAAWPGLAAPPDPSLLAPALVGVLRVPDSVVAFLAFSALSTLAIGALGALRLWHGRALPVRTVGLYLLGAVVPPLLALVLAYLRVTQFDRSISFALIAVVLAAAFYLVADRFDRIPHAERTIIGAFASGVAAAMALAFTMALDRGYLTVAFAVTAFTTAIFAVVDRIRLLRTVVVAIGLVVLGRLVWDPRIMGADVGTWPVFNWLLLGYGAPAAAFLGAAVVLRREGEDLAVRLCDALGVLFTALLLFFQTRHALNGGDPLAPTSGHVEQGLLALMSIGFAAVLIRLDLARANPVFRAASLILGVLSGWLIVVRLGLSENPLFSADPVHGPVIFSTLLLGYLLPGLAAVVLVRIARGVRPRWYVTGVAALALFLLFSYVTLEVRHAFHGESLTVWHGADAPEVWSYSVAWLALGLAFLFYGLWRNAIEPRLASAALVVLSVLKVFLYDLTGIGGFWRAFSVICLGAVLIGIGLVYQKLVFARPLARRVQ